MSQGAAGNDSIHRPRLVVIYDGDCSICERSVAFLRELDHLDALEILPSFSQEVSRRFSEIPPSDLLSSIQVIDWEGIRWQEAEGIARIFVDMPGGWPLALLLKAPGFRYLAKMAYRWVSANRHLLGDGSCATDDRRSLL